MKLFAGHRPDVTPAQGAGILLAGVPIISNLLHVFGVFDLSKEQQQALEDTINWAVIFGGLLIGGDAVLRTARNHADAKRDAAALQSPAVPADSYKVPPVPSENDLDTGELADHELEEDGLPTDAQEFAVALEDGQPAVVQPSQRES